VVKFYHNHIKRIKIDTDKQNQDAVLSQGGPRDAAVNFDTYRILQLHRAVSLPLHGFLVGLEDRSELSVKK